MKQADRGLTDTNVFSTGRQGVGPLESKVLDLLWGQDHAVTVRHVHLAFPELAYTTVMTTLDRLYRKGILARRRRGRAFAYETRCSRDELLSTRLSGHVTDLLAASGASTAILSTLVRADTSDYGDRHRSLRMRAKLLRAEAARVYAPVRLRWKKISRIMPKFDLARFWPSHF